MSYKSVLVNLDIDGPVVPIINSAIHIAKNSDARLIGFCAADAPIPMSSPWDGGMSAEIWELMRSSIEQRFIELHKQFEELTKGLIRTEWISVVETPALALVQAARLADLIILGAVDGASTGDTYRTVNPGNIVLQVGRPLLVVARETSKVSTKKVVIAWKDTREARRAVSDAIPLLILADDIVIVTVTTEADQWYDDSLSDVASFLAQHGIKTTTKVIESPKEGDGLIDFIQSHQADLIISGAYGHSRLREWVFGGMTRMLLDRVNLNRFISS